MSYSRTFILILGTESPGKMEWFFCLFLIFTLTSGDAIGNNTCKGKKRKYPEQEIQCSLSTVQLLLYL